MKHVVNIILDLEMIIINLVKNHIFNEVKWNDLFPNFADPKISSIHPFAYLLQTDVEGEIQPNALFPSITIIDDSDSKDMEANIATIEREALVRNEEIQAIEDDTEMESHIVTPSSIRALMEIKENLSENEGVWSLGSAQRRKSNIIVEIWSRNVKVKNRLYDIIRNFLLMNGRFTLCRDYDIIITEESINGQRSGSYNFDFGYMIHGGVIRLDIVYVIQQWIVDTEILDIAEINHSNEEVNSNEQE